jgi:hypothetical protein
MIDCLLEEFGRIDTRVGHARKEGRNMKQQFQREGWKDTDRMLLLDHLEVE